MGIFMKAVMILGLLLSSGFVWSFNHTVKLDGTGDYTSIQMAIDASAHGDTVLVYPGTYYENFNYSGKNITVASLELTTGNPAYRDSTIIDGNNNGSCVLVVSNENYAGIFGFILQHGSGSPYIQNGANLTRGGAFRIRNATSFNIFNCNITNYRASSGGGIHLSVGTINLKDTKIFNNYASSAGGGIYFSNNSNCFFSSTQRSSICENYAGIMNDIGASESGNVINVILDTFTVTPPTKYYSNSMYLFPPNAGYFTYDILQAFRTEINSDIYVSPTGNDNNDGLTPLTPLKSITKALHTIASDSLNVKSIYLSSGLYSSNDGQLFPLSLKAYVRIIGDSLNMPVIENLDYQSTISN